MRCCALITFHRYKKAVKTSVSVLAAFEAADLQFYSTTRSGFTTITESGDILRSMNLPTKQSIWESIQKGHACGPIQMLEELAEVQHELENSEIAALSLKVGDPNMLKTVHLEETRVKFLGKLAKKTLSRQQQEFVLSYLPKPYSAFIVF